jgi:hypothetical protein
LSRALTIQPALNCQSNSQDRDAAGVSARTAVPLKPLAGTRTKPALTMGSRWTLAVIIGVDHCAVAVRMALPEPIAWRLSPCRAKA